MTSLLFSRPHLALCRKRYVRDTVTVMRISRRLANKFARGRSIRYGQQRPLSEKTYPTPLILSLSKDEPALCFHPSAGSGCGYGASSAFRAGRDAFRARLARGAI